jgi:hypothetical protein
MAAASASTQVMGIAISAYEAVALLGQAGTPSPTQREQNGLASTAYVRQIADYSLLS